MAASNSSPPVRVATSSQVRFLRLAEPDHECREGQRTHAGLLGQLKAVTEAFIGTERPRHNRLVIALLRYAPGWQVGPPHPIGVLDMPPEAGDERAELAHRADS
jgi:hypothetical protein